jgi:hypothetical protein
MTPEIAAAYAHRALVEGYVLGAIARVKRGMRVTAGPLGAVADAGAAAGAELVVVTDDGAVDEGSLAERLGAVHAAAGGGVMALVVGSPVSEALVRHVTEARARGWSIADANATSRRDAWSSAAAWAMSRGDTLAPAHALEPRRMARFVDAAAAVGLTLVESEMAVAAPPFAHVRAMKSARSRALFATIALGARARPMIFVPSARAPKSGVARARVERIADAWVRARSAGLATDRQDATDLVRAALTVLDRAARDGRGALSFKQLLREARDGWRSLASARGARATASSTDARELAAALHALSAAEDVFLHALDPADPGWALTLLSSCTFAV